MDELLGNGASAGPPADAVRVVSAGDVAALRRLSSASAIVALVGSTCGREAVEARLAGADVVLPCADGAEPDEADLALAIAGAQTLAAATRLVRDRPRIRRNCLGGRLGGSASGSARTGAKDRQAATTPPQATARRCTRHVDTPARRKLDPIPDKARGDRQQ